MIQVARTQVEQIQVEEGGAAQAATTIGARVSAAISRRLIRSPHRRRQATPR